MGFAPLKKFWNGRPKRRNLLLTASALAVVLIVFLTARGRGGEPSQAVPTAGFSSGQGTSEAAVPGGAEEGSASLPAGEGEAAGEGDASPAASDSSAGGVSDAAGAPVAGSETEETPGQDGYSGGKISKEEYDRLEDGMTYAQAVRVIGGEGSLTGRTGNLTVYEWKGYGSGDASARLTFQSGKLSRKYQFGL